MEKKSPALRALVVEDEPLTLWSIGEILTQSGHTVIEASDGASALRALTDPSQRVDVVLLDYRLADSDHLALLATIRRLAPSTPVVLMTAHGSPEITAEALQLGACQVLNKPFDIHEIATVVLRAHSVRPH